MITSRVEAMRIQERHYECPDYTGKVISMKRPRPESTVVPEMPISPESTNSSVVHLLLHECASLVTDPSARISAQRLDATPQGKRSDASPNSPSCVMKHSNSLVEEPDVDTNSSSSTSSFQSGDNGFTLSSDNHELAEGEVITGYPEMAKWRLQMFDWACMVVDHSQIDRSAVLSMAFNTLDRYTMFEIIRPESPPITREDYQLFAMTALYMAVKVLEPFPRKMGLESFSLMSREFYQPEDIASTELEMLGALRWRITPPTSIGFCRELVGVLLTNGGESVVDMEQIYPTICDVSVSDPSFLQFSPSLIAVAALMHSARLTGRSRRAQNLLKKQALEALAIGKDRTDQVSLDLVYKKIEELYC